MGPIRLIITVLCAKRKKVSTNYSKSDPTAFAFWPILKSKHNVSDGNQRYANLYRIKVVSPTQAIPGVSIDALQFSGQSGSYMEIPYKSDSLDGSEAMTVLFYFFFEGENQNASLLNFQGMIGGFEIRLEGTRLRNIFYDTSGVRYELASSHSFIPNTWHFVGTTFNRLWESDDQFDFIYYDEDLEGYTETLTTGSYIDSIDARGTIRLGQDFHGQGSFKGLLSCIQFYSVSLYHGSGPLEWYALCDPQTWQDSSYGETTMDVVETYTTEQNKPTTLTTVQDETTTTTQSSTVSTLKENTEPNTTMHSTQGDTTILQDSTISETTITTQKQTTVNKTTKRSQTTLASITKQSTVNEECSGSQTTGMLTQKETTKIQTTPSDNIATSADELASSVTTTYLLPQSVTISPASTSTTSASFMTTYSSILSKSVPGYEPPIERCVLFFKFADDTGFVEPVQTQTLSSMSQCSALCIRDSLCTALSVGISGSSFLCATSYNHTDTKVVIGHSIYTRT